MHTKKEVNNMESKGGQDRNGKAIIVLSNGKFPIPVVFVDKGTTVEYLLVKSKSNKLMLQK